MPVAYELNQRPPAERDPGPFEGLVSYPQLCWWSLILQSTNLSPEWAILPGGLITIDKITFDF
jgi:hypothetical protein